MHSQGFVVREHTFQGQHIREYPDTLANQEDVVTLHAKSYTPSSVASGHSERDCTIIGFHANGYHKEVYETFFESLSQTLQKGHGITIGSIWMADTATHGTSAVLNDDVLGNDDSWFDHSRDVLAMINTFRGEMKRPIFAVGHSKGCNEAVGLANYHPRLFDGVILIDPSIQRSFSKSAPSMIRFILNRPDTFPSRHAAEEWYRKAPFFKSWEPKVFQRFLETAFHERDGKIVPNTSVHNQLMALMRANPEHIGISQPVSDLQRYTHPDVEVEAPLTGPLYNPGVRQAWRMLWTLRAAALIVKGEGSQMTPGNEAEERFEMMGTGPGGSGGAKAGNVESVTVPGGHFLPMTNSKGTAQAVGKWLAGRTQRWREVEEQHRIRRQEKDESSKRRLDAEVVKLYKQFNGKPWPKEPQDIRDGGQRSKL